MQYRTHEAATMCNVTVNTVRNWCKEYGDFLSPSARGSSGNRRFTGRDLDVLKYIAQLRSENMQKSAILQRLGETTFAEINAADQDEPQSDQPVALPAAQEGLHHAPALIVALDDHDRRLGALERRRLDSVTAIGLGFVGGLLFCAILIVLAWLYGGAP